MPSLTDYFAQLGLYSVALCVYDCRELGASICKDLHLERNDVYGHQVQCTSNIT